MEFTFEFLGASQTVTGSKTLLRFGKKEYLVDCGLFQGPPEIRARNWEAFPIPPKEIDGIILTHAHLDHCGFIPRMVKQGFRGPIFCTAGTRDLAEILLLDSAHLQEEDARFANETKHSRHTPALPLYETEDVKRAMPLFKAFELNQWIPLSEECNFKFRRAGHIVGSAFVEIHFNSPGAHGGKKLVFSGDLGHNRSTILKGPDPLGEVDTLVLESTYGGRLHPRENLMADLGEIISRTLGRNGVLLIPSFAVGRTQEILHLIRKLENNGKIPRVPVILDSPLAQRANEVFRKHGEDHIFDSGFLDFERDFFPLAFEAVESTDDSFLACMRSGPLIIVSAAGMLSGGRILHHLKKRLPEEQNTVLFVGYQAEGSKGRFLLDRGKIEGQIRIHHQMIPVNAEITSLEGLSAHGDSRDLMDWIQNSPHPEKIRVILNHGSLKASETLRTELLESKKVLSAEVSSPGTEYKI